MGKFFKIGKSKDPEGRRLALDSTKLPEEIIIIAVVPHEDTTYLESLIHKDLYEFRVRGEWFKLSVNQVESTIRKYNFDIQNYINTDFEYKGNKETKVIVAKGKLDRKAYSHLYSGDVQQILMKIEKLTTSICNNTNYKPTILKAGERYDLAINIACSKSYSKVHQLKNILVQMEHSKNMQNKRHVQNAKEKEVKKTKSPKKIFSFLGIGINIR